MILSTNIENYTGMKSLKIVYAKLNIVRVEFYISVYVLNKFHLDDCVNYKGQSHDTTEELQNRIIVRQWIYNDLFKSLYGHFIP